MKSIFCSTRLKWEIDRCVYCILHRLWKCPTLVCTLRDTGDANESAASSSDLLSRFYKSQVPFTWSLCFDSLPKWFHVPTYCFLFSRSCIQIAREKNPWFRAFCMSMLPIVLFRWLVTMPLASPFFPFWLARVDVLTNQNQPSTWLKKKPLF